LASKFLGGDDTDESTISVQQEHDSEEPCSIHQQQQQKDGGGVSPIPPNTVDRLRHELQSEKVKGEQVRLENEELINDNQSLVGELQNLEKELAQVQTSRDALAQKITVLQDEVEWLQARLLQEEDIEGTGTVWGSFLNTSTLIANQVEDRTYQIQKHLKDALYDKFLMEQRLLKLQKELDETHTDAENILRAKNTNTHKVKKLERHMKKCSCQEPLIFAPEQIDGKTNPRTKCRISSLTGCIAATAPAEGCEQAHGQGGPLGVGRMRHRFTMNMNTTTITCSSGEPAHAGAAHSHGPRIHSHVQQETSPSNILSDCAAGAKAATNKVCRRLSMKCISTIVPPSIGDTSPLMDPAAAGRSSTLSEGGFIGAASTHSLYGGKSNSNTTSGIDTCTSSLSCAPPSCDDDAKTGAMGGGSGMYSPLLVTIQSVTTGSGSACSKSVTTHPSPITGLASICSNKADHSKEERTKQTPQGQQGDELQPQ
jgi:hypothetical protein